MSPVSCLRAQLFRYTLAMLIGSLAFTGCQKPTTEPVLEAGNPDAPASSATAGTGGAPSATELLRKVAPSDTWDMLFMQGSRVGYTHTTVTPVKESGRKLLRIDSESSLTVTRFGQKNKQSIEIGSTETLDGRVVGFRTLTAFGPTPMEITGEWNAESGKLQLTSRMGDQQQTAAISLPPNCRGFFANEQVLQERPLAAGETVTFPALVPILNQVATIHLVSRGQESTRLLDGTSHELLRVDCMTTMPDGNEIGSTMWVSEQGEVLKSRTEAMQQETYRVTREVAMSEAPSPGFDLGIDAMVRVEPALTDPHATQRVRYRVQLQGGDPAEVFASCPSQQIQRLDDNTAELTVLAIRPDMPAEAPANVVAPLAADRFPNALVQSDDPAVLALVDKIALGETDLWRVAVAMERWVHENLTNKNFSQAFSSAAEVAQTREGDCTEHAVLLAALLRARGIPARVAIGLVYVEPNQSFGYHMWTEAFVRDRWIPLDATLAKGGIGGAHLKLLDTSLDGASAFSSFLPVAQVLGRLKIEVLEAR